MIALPRTPSLSRGPLRAFGCALALVVAATGALGRASGARRGASTSLVAATGVGLVGLVRPGWLRPVYLGWDRAARRLSRLLTTYAAWLTHTTALPAGAGPLATARSAASPRWTGRTSQPTAAYRSPSWQPGHGDAGTTPRLLRRWLADRGGPRRRWLTVCLAVLRWVSTGEPETPVRPRADTYTLY